MTETKEAVETVNARINGEEREIPGGSSIRDLLVDLGLNPSLVVVERNREIVERERYDEVEIEEGDALELVHFVGGG